MVLRVRPGGTVADTLFTYPPAQQHVEQTNGGLSFHTIPFARGPRVVGDAKGHVHYAWSDSLGARTYGPDDTLRRTTDIPFEPVPVMETDREHALASYSKEGRAAVRSEIPPTKPAFTQFLVDDKGRYWFGRPTADPDSTDWWVAWPDEQRVATATLPSEVHLHEVTNGRAYGRTTTENGAPVIVRYRVCITP